MDEKERATAGSPSEDKSELKATTSSKDPVAYETKEAGLDDTADALPTAANTVDLNSNVNARLANPLAGFTKDQLYANAARFCTEKGLEEYTETIQKGALVAQNPMDFESMDELSLEDKRALREEVTHKWKQPKRLYLMVILCSLAAAVQGWDETAINSALLVFVSAPECEDWTHSSRLASDALPSAFPTVPSPDHSASTIRYRRRLRA